MEYTAVLVFNDPTLWERISRTGPLEDFLYVIPKGGHHPGGTEKSKEGFRIDFSDPRTERAILEDLAAKFGGKIQGIPLPPTLGYYSTDRCTAFYNRHREELRPRLEDYFKKPRSDLNISQK